MRVDCQLPAAAAELHYAGRAHGISVARRDLTSTDVDTAPQGGSPFDAKLARARRGVDDQVIKVGRGSRTAATVTLPCYKNVPIY